MVVWILNSLICKFVDITFNTRYEYAGAGAFILALGIFYWLGGLHAHVEAKVGKNGE